MIDSMTTIQWVGADGETNSIHMHPGFLFLMALAKIIGGGYLVYRQGKSTHNVFKPILKEYRDAETGVTHGIAMNERKSIHMAGLKKEIFRITVA